MIKNYSKDMVFLYKGRLGVIKGFTTPDGYFWISYFEIAEPYRKIGWGRKLAQEFFPPRCKLLAIPLRSAISAEKLIAFYQSLGFKLMPDECGNPIMVREKAK